MSNQIDPNYTEAEMPRHRISGHERLMNQSLQKTSEELCRISGRNIRLEAVRSDQKRFTRATYDILSKEERPGIGTNVRTMALAVTAEEAILLAETALNAFRMALSNSPANQKHPVKH